MWCLKLFLLILPPHKSGCSTDSYQDCRVCFASFFKQFCTCTIHCSEWRFSTVNILDDCQRANQFVEWGKFYCERHIGAFECDKGWVWLSVVFHKVHHSVLIMDVKVLFFVGKKNRNVVCWTWYIICCVNRAMHFICPIQLL